jgi:hypothetical protein
VLPSRPKGVRVAVFVPLFRQRSELVHKVTTRERCAYTRSRASPWGAGDPGWSFGDDMRAVRLCASACLTMACRSSKGCPGTVVRPSRYRCARPGPVSRARHACATTSGSPANPYQCLVPGLFPSMDANDFACHAVSERLVRFDHPGVRIKSRICENF